MNKSNNSKMEKHFMMLTIFGVVLSNFSVGKRSF